MSTDTFHQRIEAARRRLASLPREARAKGDVESLLTLALREVAVSLEELHAVAEELRRQQAELRTAREAAEHERRRYRGLFEFAPDGYLVTDDQGIVQEANRSALRMLKANGSGLRGKPLVALFAAEDAQAVRDALARLQQGEHTLAWEARIRPRAARPSFPAALTVSAIQDRNGRLAGLRWLLRDITEHKKAEEHLRQVEQQLRALAFEVTLAEERERRRIAMDLHDHISQTLVLCNMKLQALREQAGSAGLGEPIAEICGQLEPLIRAVSSLTFQLSPPVLYELGFEAAAEWLAEQVQTQYGLAVKVERRGQHPPLRNEMRIVLFRAVQEILTNVVKHAHARKVRIVFTGKENELRIDVTDDGVGFDPSTAGAAATGGFGLFSTEERLRHLRGRVQIRSSPGRGTRVRLSVPLRARTRKGEAA